MTITQQIFGEPLHKPPLPSNQQSFEFGSIAELASPGKHARSINDDIAILSGIFTGCGVTFTGIIPETTVNYFAPVLVSDNLILFLTPCQ